VKCVDVKVMTVWSGKVWPFTYLGCSQCEWC